MNAPGSTTWGDPVDGVRLGVRFSRKTYRVGAPILMEVLISNRAAQPVPLVESHFLADHDLEVKTVHGATVPWTTEGEAARRRAREGVWGRRTLTLPPGGTHRVVPEQPLGVWVRLDSPGRYDVHVARTDWNNRGARIKSAAPLQMVG
jgi:hypothetical protein